jgi:sulfur-carrier protein adenylyltransferase/sulfurtransferase
LAAQRERLEGNGEIVRNERFPPSLRHSKSERDKLRYSRHLLLPEVGEIGQKKISSASVLVVGAGGLGCPALLYLAAAGVGSLTIVDNDDVSLSNLQRQVLFTEEDLGENKAERAAFRLRKLNSDIQVTAVANAFDSTCAEALVQPHDVILDCTDNFSTRYLINDVCVKFSKPLSYAAIYRFEGQSSFFRNQPDDACLRCVYPEIPKPGTIQNCTQAGVLGVLPGIFGILQVKDTLKFLLQGDVSHRFFHFDLWGEETHSFRMHKSRHCNLCNTFPRQKIHILNQEKQMTVSTLKEFSPEEVQADLASYYLVDVRTAEERAEYHLPDHAHIPLAELETRWEEVPSQKAVLLYCRGEARSAQALQLLTQKGLTNLQHLKGGALAWQARFG